LRAALLDVILTKQIEEDPFELLARDEPPKLSALRLHNGTVWRWNRPCYGVNDGVAHLRIEHRSMPSGPSIIDEMANAAFFYGLITALPGECGEIESSAIKPARSGRCALLRRWMGAARERCDIAH
jgi:hypothetical protein